METIPTCVSKNYFLFHFNFKNCLKYYKKIFLIIIFKFCFKNKLLFLEKIFGVF